MSRTGFHNAYKEYRDVTLNGAIESMYQVRIAGVDATITGAKPVHNPKSQGTTFHGLSLPPLCMVRLSSLLQWARRSAMEGSDVHSVTISIPGDLFTGKFHREITHLIFHPHPLTSTCSQNIAANRHVHISRPACPHADALVHYCRRWLPGTVCASLR